MGGFLIFFGYIHYALCGSVISSKKSGFFKVYAGKISDLVGPPCKTLNGYRGLDILIEFFKSFSQVISDHFRA